jgi:hypothetical protein
MAAAMWSEYAALLLLAMANIVVLGLGARLRLAPRFLTAWLGAQLIVITLWSPVLPVLVGQVFASNPQAVPPVRAGILLGTLVADIDFPIDQLSSSPAARVLALSAIEVAGILIGMAVWAWRRQPRWMFLTLSLWLGPALAEGGVSLLWQPVLVPRTLIWTLVPFYLLVARGILSVRLATVRATVLIFLLALDLSAVGLYYARATKWEAWDRAAAYIAARARPEDIILFHDNLMQLPFDYYFHRYHLTVTERGVPVDFPHGNAREPVVTPGDVTSLGALVKGHDRVWLVYSHEWFTDPRRTVPPALGLLGRLASVQTFIGIPHIEVYLFEVHRSSTEKINPAQ